jgi:hypothetical protein
VEIKMTDPLPMAPIEQVFTNLNKFKEFPKYQLERRSDIFFQIYLEQVLRKKFDDQSIKFILPEFPVHCLKIHGHEKKSWDNVRRISEIDWIDDNSNTNMDYLCWSQKNKTLYFIELKTDARSFEWKQYWYYKYFSTSEDWPWEKLLKFIQDQTTTSRSKGKYLAAFNYILEKNPELVQTSKNPPITKKEFHYIAPSSMLQKNDFSKRSEVREEIANKLISLTEFADCISEVDELSSHFTASLRNWDE